MNPYQQPSMPTDKCAGVAVVPTFFFGPLGLRYVCVVSGLVLIVVALDGVCTFGILSAVGSS